MPLRCLLLQWRVLAGSQFKLDIVHLSCVIAIGVVSASAVSILEVGALLPVFTTW